MTGQNALHRGDHGYGRTCVCGGPKHKSSFRCARCRAALRVETADYTTGRHEAIVTFKDDDTGEVQTRQCYGATAPEQIGHGLRQLRPGNWRVLSRSTPDTILTDLRRSAT